MSILNTARREAASGKADAAVIFVHGYGADGKDLLGIGDAVAGHLPNVTFLAPDAPDRCTNNPMGFQWFPIPWLDGSSEAAAEAGMVRAVGLLDAYLDEVMASEELAADRIVLFGFSQGTMMSLHVGPRRPEELAGIVGFSGRLLAPELLAADLRSKPPVLLVHGDMDDVVPPSSMAEAKAGLKAAGLPVATHMSRGIGHGIAPDGLGLAVGFIRDALKIEG